MFVSALRFAPLLLVALVLLVGCRPTRELTPIRPFALPTVAQLDSVGRVRSSQLKNLTGQGVVEVASPESERVVSATVRIARPDSIYLKATVFGLTVAEGLATTDSVFVYNRIANELTLGRYSPEAAAATVGVPLSFADLSTFLTGLVPLPPGPPESLLAVGDTAVMLTYRVGPDSVVQRYWLHPNDLFVQRTEWRRGTEVLFDGHFRDFQRFENGLFLPKEIEIVRPRTGQRARVTYSSLRINQPDLNLRLRVARDATRTRRDF